MLSGMGSRRFCLRRRCLPARASAYSRGLVALSLCVVAATARPSVARAESEDDDVDPLALQTHAFVSQGFIKTTRNNYLAESKRGSFEFSEVGINFTKGLTDNLRVGVQLFSHDLGPLGNYRTQFDWYYLDYRLFDWLGLRAGHTKIPFGLYNDSSDFDSARVPILLPQSVYPIDHRDYLLAQTGAEIYGNVRLGDLGGLEYRAYGGTLSMDTPAPPAPGISVNNLDVPYVFGARVMWSTPVSGLLAGASFQSLRIDADYDFEPQLIPPLQAFQLLPPDFDGRLSAKFRVKLSVASLEYQNGGLLLAAEYSRWVGEFESRAPALLPPHVTNERYYAMISYRVAPWFTPGAYYSAYFPNVEQRGGSRANYQRDVAVSVRYDLTNHWLFKVEGHVLDGTAALDKNSNGGQAPANLAKQWGMLLLKTTAYF